MSASAPAPAPKPSKPIATKTVLRDIRVALGVIVTVGEGVLLTLPAGSVHDAVAVALPACAAVAAYLLKLGD